MVVRKRIIIGILGKSSPNCLKMVCKPPLFRQNRQLQVGGFVKFAMGVVYFLKIRMVGDCEQNLAMEGGVQ